MTMVQILLGLLFVGLGSFVVLAAAFSWRRTRRFVSESATAFGVVVALRERRGRPGRPKTYAPVVRFTPLGGTVTEFEDDTSYSPPRHLIGDRVHVRYRRQDPTDARLSSRTGLYAMEFSFAAVGLVFFAVGCVMLYTRAFG